ncbi:hydroxyacylglutathione hydrolase [Pseudanabaena sp. FACHB-1998]|uniref:hydroxyacylglutathione hydrolase n=1 Tax=Pseudanabaena sp. FACHB-1998 TaxID=2692858 RepID=UPI001680A03F|nr:hydroxyacylglutathione hydrolase [Pseudanabaena sp. FACHB-1998]MBD2179159.1 hydroxyacylglutathione hydrolase [Pseudanabaena sp. FACHB-1998]
MHIYRLPVLSDNYIFVLHDPASNTAAVVDPAVAEPVLAKLEELGANLVAIFNTHHHGDHVGGNNALIKKFPHAIVYGGEKDHDRIPHQQVFLKGGDRVNFGDREAEVFFVPGHTYAHIAYYFPAVGDQGGELFCGDTLFAGGCGRLFEGTPAQMLESIDQLRKLPDDTRVWCAHEYTLGNLKFALTVDRENPDLQERMVTATAMRQRGESTVPTTIGLEKRTNPFMRWDVPAIQRSAGIDIPDRVFARIRGQKDNFAG